MTKVFISNPLRNAHKDNLKLMNDLRNYGDTYLISGRYIYDEDINNGIVNAKIQDNITDAALAFNEKEDFLCLLGDALIVALFVIKLGALGKKPKLLRWDSRLNSFRHVNLTNGD